MSQVTLPLPSLGAAGATAAVDVVRLALTYLNGGTPQGSAKLPQVGSALLAGQRMPGTTVPASAGAAVPEASAQAPVQHRAVLAKSGAEGSAVLLPGKSSMPSEAARAPEGPARPGGRPTGRDVFVAGRSDHAALVMRSHGAIAGLLRTDAGLQVADSVLRKIDDRLARMQDLVRRATAGPPTAQARAALDLPFQKLKQEVVGLVPPVAPGGGTETLPTGPSGRAVLAARAVSSSDSMRLAQDINLPAATLQGKIPIIVQALAGSGLSTESRLAEAEAILAVVRSNGGEVQKLIAGQRDVVGDLLSRELSRRIGLSDPPVVRPPSALRPGAGLSSAVASALLVPLLPASVGQGAAMSVSMSTAMISARGAVDGEPPLVGSDVGSDGKQVRQVSAESLALLIAQPHRAGIAALLSPSASSLDEPGANGSNSHMAVSDRPLPMPPPLSGMAAELLFGLVPGWRARSREGLARPKRPSGRRKKRRPDRNGDDPFT